MVLEVSASLTTFQTVGISVTELADQVVYVPMPKIVKDVVES